MPVGDPTAPGGGSDPARFGHPLFCQAWAAFFPDAALVPDRTSGILCHLGASVGAYRWSSVVRGRNVAPRAMWAVPSPGDLAAAADRLDASFSLQSEGEPSGCTPAEAAVSFRRSGMDALALDHFVVLK